MADVRCFMNRKRIFKNIAGISLICMGIAVMLYPALKEHYYDAKQKAALSSYREAIHSIQVTDEDIMEELFVNPTEIAHIQNEEQLQRERLFKISKGLPIEATLIIEKIELVVPVIKGATKKHLNISISSIDGTGKPWDRGNYVLAGHRSRTFGRYFNRLGEIEIDDEIVVMDAKQNQYIYRVISKEVVDEKELSVLDYNNRSEITLITCDPIHVKNPSTRLVIKAIEVNRSLIDLESSFDHSE